MKYLSIVLFSILFFSTQRITARMIAPAKTMCFSLKNSYGETIINVKMYPSKVIMGDVTTMRSDGSGDESMGYNAQETSTNTYKITFSNPAPKFETGMKWAKNTSFRIVNLKRGEEALQVKILKYNSKTKKYYTVTRTFYKCAD